MKKINYIALAATLPFSIAMAAPAHNATGIQHFIAKLQLANAHKLNPISYKGPRPFSFYQETCSKQAAPQAYGHADGSAVLTFNPKTNTLKYDIAYQGLSGSPIMAHFHIGKAGAPGPIVQTICGQPPKNRKDLGYSAAPTSSKLCPAGRSGRFQGSYVLGGNPEDHLTLSQERQALEKGTLYINIHTCLNEAGEIRGQVVSVK